VRKKIVFIIGAQKAGTTTLFNHLVQHPQIAASKKEPHFFDYSYTGRSRDYEKILGHKWRLGVRWLVDASPSYLFHPAVPARIAAHYPDSQLIALLRDPAERAVSHYFHNLRKGRETRPFSLAIQQELDTAPSISETDGYDNPTGALRHFSYISRGMYVDQIRRYFSFFERSQMLIQASEEFFSDFSTTREVFARLGLSGIEVAHCHFNEGQYSSSEANAMASEIRSLFTAKNRELESLLHQTFPWS
jgi:hypothetical protein